MSVLDVALAGVGLELAAVATEEGEAPHEAEGALVSVATRRMEAGLRWAGELDARARDAEIRARDYETIVENVRKSAGFRIGRALTAPFRLLRGFVVPESRRS